MSTSKRVSDDNHAKDAAVISGERRLTFEQLDNAAARAATVLASAGVGRGDVVALCAYNGFAYFVFERAVRFVGARLTPVNWHLTPSEIAFILNDCDAAAVIMHTAFLTREMRSAIGERPLFVEPVAEEIVAAYGLDTAAKSIAPKDVALSQVLGTAKPIESPLQEDIPALFYTSGTSGTPKAVVRPAVPKEIEAALRRRAQAAFALHTSSRIVALMTGPLYHSAPYAYAMNVLNSGGTIVLQPRFSPTQLLKDVEAFGITHLHMVPIMFQRLLALDEQVRNGVDLSTLESVVHGAAPCPPEVKSRMIEWWGPIIHEYYAMTEVGFIATSTSQEWQNHPGSVGRAPSGVEIEIQDASAATLPAGKIGDICVRHEATEMFSYHGDEEKTKASRRNGFVVTGDVGYLDDDGFLYISDRKTDMVLSGGVNIYPAEVEAAMARIESIRDAVVFGIPDEEFGERLVAAVVRRSDVAAGDIKRELRQDLAGFKVPKEITFFKELPREDTGKIKKREVREAYIAQKGHDVD